MSEANTDGGHPLRVIQWATGGIGRAAIQGVLAHPDLDLVGCWVHSESKVGVDVGELVGGEPVGVTATDDVEALLDLDADCVIYAPVLADPDVIERILASGANVVTPLNWFFLGDRDDSALEAACEAAGTTLHGTGIHPGGVTERIPLLASCFTGSVTHVRAEEFSDIRTYGAPDVVEHIMLFGRTPDEAAASSMPSILGTGFLQSVAMLGHQLGFALDPEPVTTHEVAVATAPIDSPIGVIEPGLVAAQKFRWVATVRGEPVITVATNWFMGEEHLDPAWTFGPEGERFEIEVNGDPSTHLTVHGWHPDSIAAGLARNPGIVATANHCVSAVPTVVAAEPGLKTYLDLPMYTGRAAEHLR